MKEEEDDDDQFIYYYVQPGDTLLKLSFVTQLSSKVIMASNNMHNNEIAEGMVSKLLLFNIYFCRC